MTWPKRVYFAASPTVDGFDEMCTTMTEARDIARLRNKRRFQGVDDWHAVKYVFDAANRPR